MGDQGLADHNSCGYYVIKYATDHAKANYSATTSHHVDAQPKDKKKILLAQTQAKAATDVISSLSSEADTKFCEAHSKRAYSSGERSSTRDIK